jgi:hypothetical protein
MRIPSTKRLTATFRDLSPAQANLMRKIAHAVDDAEALETLINAECESTAAYVRSMHSSPYDSHGWRVTVALHALDSILGTYGVECLRLARDSEFEAPAYEYLNTGDTYGTTLIYSRRGDSLTIGSWGDIAETRECV